MHTKVYDLLLTQKSNYVPCSEGVRNDELCPACQLFGTIYRSSGKNQMKSAASHVRFSDAKLTKNKGMMGKVTLPALSVPKFSNELMYLHLNSTNAPKHEFNADFEVLENNSPRMFHQGDVCINGRKYYWHQPDFVLPSGEMETKLNSTITPLNVGNEFSFDIFFEHISKEELDTLAFATDFGDDDIHYQKVGYAKPLGFGSSKVSVNSIELKTLSADPGKPLYELRPYTQRERDFHKIPMIDRKAAEELLTITNFYFLKGRTISYPFTQGHAHDKNEKGFEILDFPCNQFFGQAPGSDEQIHEFCTLKYNTKFPRFKKIDVNGKNESPLYTYLKSQKKGRIPWNFTKFLVNRNGEVVARFKPTDKPENFEGEIEKLI